MMSDWLEELPPAAREYLEGKRLDEVEHHIFSAELSSASVLPPVLRSLAGGQNVVYAAIGDHQRVRFTGSFGDFRFSVRIETVLTSGGVDKDGVW